MKKIEYEDKVALQNDESVAIKNKVTAENMNEIKTAINENAQELEQTQSDVKDLQSENIAQSERISELEKENESLKNIFPTRTSLRRKHNIK